MPWLNLPWCIGLRYEQKRTAWARQRAVPASTSLAMASPYLCSARVTGQHLRAWRQAAFQVPCRLRRKGFYSRAADKSIYSLARLNGRRDLGSHYAHRGHRSTVNGRSGTVYAAPGDKSACGNSRM